MEFGPPEIFGRVTFCDDIRMEIDGKLTLVGCYGADLVIQTPFPILIAKLGIVVHFYEKPTEDRLPLKLEIFFPGDSENIPSIVSETQLSDISFPEESINLRDEDTRRVAQMHIILSPVNILSEGYIRVRLTKGANTYRIGRIRVGLIKNIL